MRTNSVAAAVKPPLESIEEPSKSSRKNATIVRKDKRGLWTNEALNKAMEAIDNGYTYNEVCSQYGNPRSSLRDHVNGKTRSRKMGPKGILIADEEIALCAYNEAMADCGAPHTYTSQIKSKAND